MAADASVYVLGILYKLNVMEGTSLRVIVFRTEMDFKGLSTRWTVN